MFSLKWGNTEHFLYDNLCTKKRLRVEKCFWYRRKSILYTYIRWANNILLSFKGSGEDKQRLLLVVSVGLMHSVYDTHNKAPLCSQTALQFPKAIRAANISLSDTANGMLLNTNGHRSTTTPCMLLLFLLCKCVLLLLQVYVAATRACCCGWCC